MDEKENSRPTLTLKSPRKPKGPALPELVPAPPRKSSRLNPDRPRKPVKPATRQAPGKRSPTPDTANKVVKKVAKKEQVKPPPKPLPVFTGPSAIILCFRKHWPDLFPPRNPVPLQIGVLNEIVRYLQQAGEPFDKKQVCRALGIHCRRYEYLKGMTCAPYRVGLDGSLTPISDRDREYALKALEKIKAEHRNAG